MPEENNISWLKMLLDAAYVGILGYSLYYMLQTGENVNFFI